MESKNTCRKCKHFVVDDKVNGVGHCSKNNVVMFSTRNACKDYDDNIDNIKERAIRIHDDAIDALRYYMNKPGNLKILPSTPSSDIISNRRMDPMDNKGDSVPYIAFESALARMDRHNRWLIIVIIVFVILFFISNAIWIYEWKSYFDDYTIEIEMDDDVNDD